MSIRTVLSPHIRHDEETGFFFRRPDHEPRLSRGANIAVAMGAVASRAVLEERTRCEHPDGRAENVAEHSLMLAKIAPYLVAELYPGEDINRVALLSTLHDDLENWVLDVATDNASMEVLVSKAEREALAFARALEEYADIPAYVDALQEYEEQKTFASRSVRCVDKLMVMLIQLPNDGVVIRQNYTPDGYHRMYRARHQALLMEYPDMEKILAIYLELSQEVARLAWPELAAEVL